MPIRVRQREQADRVGESQHVVKHLSAVRCVPETNKEIDICPAKQICNHKQLFREALQSLPGYLQHIHANIFGGFSVDRFPLDDDARSHCLVDSNRQ